MSSILKSTALTLLVPFALRATSALAQTTRKPAPPASPVAFSQAYLVVKDIAATRTLLVDGLGGTAGTAGTVEVVKFPGLLVALSAGEPKGGTRGSTVSHLGFEVKDLPALVKGLKAAKAKLVTREETNMVYTVADDIATIPDQQTVSAVVQTPDGVNIRLVQNTEAAAPITFRSIHFAPASMADTMDWYVRAFGARTGDRGFGFQSLDLGTRTRALMFTLAPDKVEGTEGRSLARIGFEVKGVAALVKKLQGLGAKVVKPLGKAETGASSAVVSDPWGTLIELTEGLSL